MPGRHLESLSESLHLNALCRYALDSSTSISCTVLRELIATTFINFLAWLRYNETSRQQCSAAGVPSTSINETASVVQKVNQQQAVCMLLVHSQSLRWLGINSERSVVYTDIIVDCYLHVLATSVSACVLPYKCTWFNSQNPDKPKMSLCRTEHSETLWFNSAAQAQYDFVLIPGSILNSHFVIVVIDLQGACMHVCDSMLGSHNTIVYQVARYMCQDYYAATGKHADLSMFTYSNYCTLDSDFLVQQDSHNST